MSEIPLTAEQRQALESLHTWKALVGIRLNPVVGEFDAAHLKEINRRIFEKLPALGFDNVTPGEFRPPVGSGFDWLKTRTFETIDIRAHVAYSRMDESAQARLDDILKGADPIALSKLDTAEFTKAMGTLYSQLDYIHPFKDGNSRTLREFTHQLAEASGYKLDWDQFGQIPIGRDLLYIARDLCVNELALPHIVHDVTKRDVLLTIDQLEGNRDLPDLLQDAIEPLPATAAPSQASSQTSAYSQIEPSLEEQLRDQETSRMQFKSQHYADHVDEPGMDTL